MDPYDIWGVRAVQGVQQEEVVPRSGFPYKVCNPNYKSNDVVNFVEYHVDTLTQFKDIVEKFGKKGKFGGWLSFNMNLG